MDIPREGARRRKIVRRALAGGVLVAAAAAGAWLLSRLEPAAPEVERAGLLIDTVRRGPFERNVRGMGALTPEDVLFIPAISEGRVERVWLRPGAAVRPETVLLTLSNPELSLAAEDLRWQVKAAEATMTDLRVKLETSRLDLQAAVARVESESVQARLKWERDEALAKQGLTPDLTVKLSRATAEELEKRLVIEKKRLEISVESAAAQVAVQEVSIAKLKAAHELKQQQVEALKIRAGSGGVLQELPVEAGQRVTPGTLLAKVAQPQKLKAALRIAETLAKEVAIGQRAQIDTRNGVIPGRVARIDPASVNGTVTVDVQLTGPLPGGARPELSVDGTVELERLENAVYVQRPVGGQPNSRMGLFRLTGDGGEAVRVTVKLGRMSVDSVEVLEGLQPGDKVIISDMAANDAHNRIRLH